MIIEEQFRPENWSYGHSYGAAYELADIVGYTTGHGDGDEIMMTSLHHTFSLQQEILVFRSSIEKEPLTLDPLTPDFKTPANTSTPLKGPQVYKFQHWAKYVLSFSFVFGID